MSIIDEIKADVNGLRTIEEWLGAGGEPVGLGLAISRGYICQLCPENKKGNWWDHVKTKLADTIRTHIALKNRMDLRIPEEAELGTCAVCLCNIPLKIWCPIEHIKAHTSPETLAKFPEACWQKSEIKELEP